jgi:hypothetical protein
MTTELFHVLGIKIGYLIRWLSQDVQNVLLELGLLIVFALVIEKLLREYSVKVVLRLYEVVVR